MKPGKGLARAIWGAERDGCRWCLSRCDKPVRAERTEGDAPCRRCAALRGATRRSATSSTSNQVVLVALRQARPRRAGGSAGPFVPNAAGALLAPLCAALLVRSRERRAATRWRLSRCDKPARAERAAVLGPSCQTRPERSLRRSARRYSSQRDEFHLRPGGACRAATSPPA